MWLRLGDEFLNLNLVTSVDFGTDDDGRPTATVEMVFGYGDTRHYVGQDAETLRQVLANLAANGEPVSAEGGAA